MSKRRNRRRFYPEFYTEEELKRHENEKNSLIENEGNEENNEGEEITEKIDGGETEKSEKIEEPAEEQIEKPIEEPIKKRIEETVEKSIEIIEEKGGFTQNIYDIENPIVYQESGAYTYTDIEEKKIDEPANFNGLVYPIKADAGAVHKQIDHMEQDYLQQKIDILNSNQNINSMMDDMNNMNDTDDMDDTDGIKIEIPPHMDIDEMPGEQYVDYNENDEEIYPWFSENPIPIVHNENENENEYKENTAKIEEKVEEIKTEQTIPVFSQMSVIPVMPELSVPANENKNNIAEVQPDIEIAHEYKPEAGIKIIEEPPEIYTDSKIIPFDREKAIEYARRWALDRNPNYYNFEELGGDCTNYISQILLAGGCKMDKSSLIYGWYYNHANDKSPSWTGVEQLHDYLIRDKERGIIAKEIGLNEVEAGDIVQLSFNGKTFQHTPFVVSVKRMPSGELSFDRIKICAHSFDSENRAMDTYQWRKIRFIRILGYKEN